MTGRKVVYLSWRLSKQHASDWRGHVPDSDGSRTMTQRGKAGRQPWVATATFTSAFHLHSRLPQLPSRYLSEIIGSSITGFKLFILLNYR